MLCWARCQTGASRPKGSRYDSLVRSGGLVPHAVDLVAKLLALVDEAESEIGPDVWKLRI